MEKIYIADYNYPLPEEKIAKYPLAQRDHSKLLIYRDGQVREDLFYHVGDYIPAQSLLIYNNTRVIQARLVFHKSSHDGIAGARVEVFCLEPIQPHDYQLALSSQKGCTWKCMIGNAKKWKSEDLAMPVRLHSGETITLYAQRGEQMGNTYAVHFRWDNEQISFAELLDCAGELPIPPYLNRKTEESDKTTYQTVYSHIEGSVAAPTAGLHFTREVLDDLRQRGIQTAELTLHVGAGTFQPVKSEDANCHPMHTEIIAVPRDTIAQIRQQLGHIVAVGTTSMRTLESLYYIGLMLYRQQNEWTTLSELHVPQFMPYEEENIAFAQTAEGQTAQMLDTILAYLDATHQTTLHAETQIMIEPGYRFHIVEQLITNFHQPQSTLLLLVSAFVGGDWHTIYDYALTHEFRFLSYGDSSILYKHD